MGNKLWPCLLSACVCVFFQAEFHLEVGPRWVNEWNVQVEGGEGRKQVHRWVGAYQAWRKGNDVWSSSPYQDMIYYLALSTFAFLFFFTFILPPSPRHIHLLQTTSWLKGSKIISFHCNVSGELVGKKKFRQLFFTSRGLCAYVWSDKECFIKKTLGTWACVHLGPLFMGRPHIRWEEKALWFICSSFHSWFPSFPPLISILGAGGAYQRWRSRGRKIEACEGRESEGEGDGILPVGTLFKWAQTGDEEGRGDSLLLNKQLWLNCVLSNQVWWWRGGEVGFCPFFLFEFRISMKLSNYVSSSLCVCVKERKRANG